MAVALYWIVQADATAAPSAAQVVAGQDGTGAAALASGSEAYTAAGDYSEASAFSGASAGTAYKQYWVPYDGVTYGSVVASATITTTNPQTVSVPAGSLTLTKYAPTVTATANQTIAVPAGSLTLTGYAPTVTATANQTISVPAGSITLTGFAPTVTATDHKTVSVPAGSLTLTGYAPTIQVNANQTVQVPAGALTLTGFAPTVTKTENNQIAIPVGSLTLTGYAPTVSNGVIANSTGAVLYLSPRLTTGLFTATGVQSATDLASWLPPAGQPIGFLMLQGQKVPVMIDPAWYKFLHFVGEVKLGGITTASVPDVISAVETTQTTSATVAATVAAVEQMGTTNAAALSAVVQVSKVNALEGSDQIPLVQSQVG